MKIAEGHKTKLIWVNVPHNGMSLRLEADDRELPVITATVRLRDMEGVVTDAFRVRIYVGDELTATMTVYRGHGYAVKLAKALMYAALSRQGHHRRTTANKKALVPEMSCKED